MSLRLSDIVTILYCHVDHDSRCALMKELLPAWKVALTEHATEVTLKPDTETGTLKLYMALPLEIAMSFIQTHGPLAIDTICAKNEAFKAAFDAYDD